MNTVEFIKVVEERKKKITYTLDSKGGEYWRGENPFHNFDTAAEMDDVSPEEALWGFCLKHLVSIRDMMKSDETLTEEMIDEKIGDAVNYFILLEGIFRRDRLSKWDFTTNSHFVSGIDLNDDDLRAHIKGNIGETRCTKCEDDEWGCECKETGRSFAI